MVTDVSFDNDTDTRRPASVVERNVHIANTGEPSKAMLIAREKNREAVRRIAKSQGPAIFHLEGALIQGNTRIRMLPRESANEDTRSPYVIDRFNLEHSQPSIHTAESERIQLILDEPANDLTGLRTNANLIHSSEELDKWKAIPIDLEQNNPVGGSTSLQVYTQLTASLGGDNDGPTLIFSASNTMTPYYLGRGTYIVSGEMADRIIPAWSEPVEKGVRKYSGWVIYHTGFTSSPTEQVQVVNHQAYEDRIEELHSYAEHDEEIEAVNESSINDQKSFMEMTGFLRRAGLMMLDNGNLRAIWRENGGHNVGLQFQGEQSVLYVMFKRHSNGGETERTAGIGTFDNIIKQLRELDLLSFVNG